MIGRFRARGATSASAVTEGGPTTAYDFPISDPHNPGLPLTASYGLNCWVYNPDTNSVQGRLAVLNWRKCGAVVQPSMTPLFLDSMWRGAGPEADDAPPDFNGEEIGMDGDEMPLFAIKRHNKGVNILFFDGSVRNTGVKDLWNLPWHLNYIAATNMVFPGWMN